MRKKSFFFGLLLHLGLSMNPIQGHAQIANTLTAADKVFGLSKFWQEVNYNFAYFNNISRLSWDSAYKALIPEVIATPNDYAYYRLLEKFCALLKDGHTNINMPSINGVSFMNNTFGDYLLVLKSIAGKVIVKRTFKKDGDLFPLGSEIISVNGLPTKQYIRDSIAPYISASTDYARTYLASSMLLRGFPGSTFLIKIRKPNGEAAEYTLTHARAKDSIFIPSIEYTEEKNKGLLEHKTFDGNIEYVALNSFSDPRISPLFEKLLDSLKKAKGIIIDLRNNSGGDDGIAFNIVKHFIQDSVLIGSSSMTRMYDPYSTAIGRYVNLTDTAGNASKKEAWLLYHGFAVFDKPGIFQSKIDPGTVKINAPVVILTGINTESAAEDFLIAADNQKHIKRIGESTSGSSGMPYRFDLPGGGSARVCVKKDMYPDGREFVGYGIQPHIEVSPTITDYLENKDPALKTALQYLKSYRN
jgi:C-terminal processing protease CtpA/Prc